MKTKIPFAFLLFITVVTSCRTPRYIYAPGPQNMPFLQKAGDHQFNAWYSTNGGNDLITDTIRSYNGLDFQGAVAVTNHFAIIGSLGYRWEKEVLSDNFRFDATTNSDVRYKRMNWDAGLGYFSSIHSRDKVYFQIFAGGGAGRYTINDQGTYTDYNQNPPAYLPYARFHEADVVRFYLQPAFQFGFNEHFKLHVGARLMNVHYRKIHTDYTLTEQTDYRLTNLQGKTFSFFEPVIDMKFGIPGAPWVRPNIQLSISSGLQNHDTRNFNASFGLAFQVRGKGNSE